jgi:biofilm PGA synthesis N-glycosyltransferase PgaC
MTTIFIWWNLLFPLMDLAYTIGFLPGILLACFGYFWIVGPMTLALLPVAAVLNRIMLHASEEMFRSEGLVIRKNWFGFIFYMLAYSMILQPACVLGYISELLKLRKSWGTK